MRLVVYHKSWFSSPGRCLVSTEVQEVEPILLCCLIMLYPQELPLHVLPLDFFALSLQWLHLLVVGSSQRKVGPL